MMKRVSRNLASAAVIVVAVIAASGARADDKDHDNQPNRYVATKLTSDVPGQATNTDSVLQNAWGVAFTPGNSPFWVSDNATGCATLYDGQGVPQTPPTPLLVKIPLGRSPEPALLGVNKHGYLHSRQPRASHNVLNDTPFRLPSSCRLLRARSSDVPRSEAVAVATRYLAGPRYTTASMARPCCTDRSLGREDWTVYQGPAPDPGSHRAIQSEPRSRSSHPGAAQSDELGCL
jgi:hypothetical protein